MKRTYELRLSITTLHKKESRVFFIKYHSLSQTITLSLSNLFKKIYLFINRKE